MLRHSESKCLLDLLKRFFFIFNTKSLYIFGAGVSAQYIKPKYKLYQDARKLVSNNLLYSPYINTVSEIKLNDKETARFEITGTSHILHQTFDGRLLINETNTDYIDEVIASYPSILEYICALSYSLSEFPIKCPEYQIFNLINKFSIIATLNHDHLASNFINKCKIIPLHGTIEPTLRTIIETNQLFYSDNVNKCLFKDLHLATKEEEFLLYKKEYLDFVEELQIDNFIYIVIIGYSFFKKNDMNIYDHITYDLLRSYIQDNVCKVIVIDPQPYYVADIIARTISNLDVICYPLKWNSFVYAWINTNKFKANYSYYSQIDLKRFVSLYNILSLEENNCQIFNDEEFSTLFKKSTRL